MAYSYYHPTVSATVGANQYTLPTGNLRLSNEPVSRAGSFAITLFNSKVIQSVDGWLVRAQFSYPHLENSVDNDIRIFIEDLLDAGQCTVDFDPDGEFDPENRTIDFVLESAPEAVVADFVGRARHKPSSLNLVSRRQFTAPVEWIIQ